MATIAVAHADLMAKGGGEAVCMNVLEALQHRHDVTLFALNDVDMAELNRYFDTNVTNVAIRRPRRRWLGVVENGNLQLYNLRNALLNRFVDRHRSEFDLVVGTDNELSVSGPLIQYIHTPRFGRLVVSKRVDEDSFVDHLYDWLSYRFGGYDAEEVRSSVLLSNSKWMADVVQDVYEARPRVVHPPVDTRGFVDRSLAEREPGFVTVGRLARYKNVERNVEIVDRVRERGHDVHLHVVGPSYDETYRRELDEMAAGRDYVTIEGELPRSELTQLISTHRYGLHGKRHEHFGMAVAELAAGGTIPFVPDNGGQREIVDGHDELVYNTVEEAVEKIDRVLSDSALQRELRTDSDEIAERFGRERFKREFVDVVAETLNDRPASVEATALR